MKRRPVPVLLLAVLLFSGCPAFLKTHDPGPFARLNEEVLASPWGVNNSLKAKIFEEIYFKEKGGKNFEARLFRYLDSDDKYYWIGLFLCEPDYTNINDFDLSLRVLTEGLRTRAVEEHKIRYYWTVAKLLYDHSRREESRPYFETARSLSKKYPGNKPAWTLEEDRAIFKFNGWSDWD